jgi:hypothetical protein
MKSRVRKKNDLDPDGVRVVVNWDKFLPNTSVFIPCVNTDNAKQQIKKICSDFDYEITLKVTIYRGKLGVRAWRTV